MTCLLLQLVGAVLLFDADGSTFAETLPITSSGLNTQISAPVNHPGGTVQYDITGGTRPGGGQNLFHSFGEFGVPANNIANFLNETTLPTSNILARVTGGNISNIFGTIQTTGFGDANLFLLNSAGFVFGPNATLNVGGTISFTTADYLRLADGVRFNAIPDIAADALLTTSPVTAFGFLGANAASIAIQGGNLEVLDGKALAFIGGPRVFTTDVGVTVPSGVSMSGGSLSAPNGLIYMATVTSPGEVQIPTLSGLQLASLGSPSSDPTVIRIRSGEFVMDHAFLTVTNTSDVAQSAIEVTVQGAMALKNASSISTETLGAGYGSDVHIAAQSVQMNGSFIKSTTMGDGHSGDISILDAQTVSLINGAQIVSSTSGTGAGGDINVAATDTVSISGFDATGSLTGVTSVLIVDQNTGFPAVTSGIFSLTSSASLNGSGGQIHLSAPTATMTLQNGGTIATIASGNAPGGDIAVESQTLNVANGGQIASFTGIDLALGELTDGTGPGGTVTVSAQDSLSLSGYSADLAALSSSISSQSFGAAKGGDIAASAVTITLENGAQLVASGFGDALTGNISVSAPSSLHISGSNPFGFSQIQTTTGSIAVTAGSVTITEQGFVSAGGDIAFQVQNDFNITAGGSLSTSGGTIGINADEVVVSGQTPERSTIQSISPGDIAAGDITITVRDLQVADRGLIRSEGSGSAQNGNIIIKNADSVSITNLGEISTFNQAGPAAEVNIGAHTVTLNQGVISTTASGAGNASTINLTSDSTTIDMSLISSATNGGTARGGDVTIIASNNLTIKGLFTNDSGLTSASGILARTFAIGDAGNVVVHAGNIQISGGGGINNGSLSSGNAGSVTIEGTQSPAHSILIDGAGSGIFTDTQSTGVGGNIVINSDSVTLQNGGTLSAETSGTAPSAMGGTITVTATNQVTLTGGASITASSIGPGNAGSIKINAGQQLDMRDSSIKTEAAHASGGDIKIQAVERVRLVNSTISTSVLGESGSGGNISIDPNVVVLQNSQVIAQAVQGAGGNITITTPLFLADQTSRVSASSEFGLNGTVTIQSPTSNLSGSLGTLPSKPSQAQSLLTQRCAALVNGQASSFVVAGREQLPADPGGWLTSPLALAGIDAERFGDGTLAEGTSNLEPRTSGLLANDTVSLRRLTPAGFLIANFADSEATGCHS
jgi:filamentous hemagglutinin family protein